MELAFVFLVLMLSFSANVEACSCVETRPSELIAQANSVYAGEAIKAELIPGKGIKTTFVVKEVFKGNVKPKSKVSVISKGTGDGDCGLQYSLAKTHIILENKDNEVSSCSGYDEYYPEKYHDTELTKTIFSRGILEELRRQKQNKSKQ